jgi:hypothetical protein
VIRGGLEQWAGPAGRAAAVGPQAAEGDRDQLHRVAEFMLLQGVDSDWLLM